MQQKFILKHLLYRTTHLQPRNLITPKHHTHEKVDRKKSIDVCVPDSFVSDADINTKWNGILLFVYTSINLQ